jgi:hypothetical protein
MKRTRLGLGGSQKKKMSRKRGGVEPAYNACIKQIAVLEKDSSKKSKTGKSLQKYKTLRDAVEIMKTESDALQRTIRTLETQKQSLRPVYQETIHGLLQQIFLLRKQVAKTTDPKVLISVPSMCKLDATWDPFVARTDAHVPKVFKGREVERHRYNRKETT